MLNEKEINYIKMLERKINKDLKKINENVKFVKIKVSKEDMQACITTIIHARQWLKFKVKQTYLGEKENNLFGIQRDTQLQVQLLNQIIREG